MKSGKVEIRTKQLEEINTKLNEAKLEAEKANLAKSEFLSRMSHELRTPLNSILGFAQLLEMNELKPIQKRGVNNILKSGKYLLNLINEVLDLSRIEAGELTISLEPILLKEIISESLDIIHPIADKKAIKIEVETTDLHKYVLADHQKLKQVLLNLLNNAVKYNKENGLITIKIIYNNKKVKIYVTDTGNGIATENIPKLFNPFQRFGYEISNIEGTGLGLAVSKKLMNAMNGSIGVESEIDIGSTFWIELPKIENHNEINQHIDNFLSNKTENLNINGTLLYIEDNISNQQLVKQIIDTQRPKVNLYMDSIGLNAIKFALEYKPNIIILDLDLPDIHGSKVLKLLQKNPITESIPVIVLSADVTDNQIKNLINLGAKAYIGKPFNVHEFLKVIDEYLNE